MGGLERLRQTCMASRSRDYAISSSFLTFPLIPSQRNLWKVLSEVDVEGLHLEAINGFLYDVLFIRLCQISWNV